MAQQDVSSADWVGRQFVQVYYQVLRKDPSVIHRFYKPTSQLTITDLTQSSPRSSIATGEQNIQQQVDAFIAGAQAKPQYIDAQYSAHGGVVLMVDGDLHFSSGAQARFFQVFFLAPQEKGYYVHNDLLRISSLPQNDSATQASHAPLANGRPAKAQATKQQAQQPAVPQTPPAPESSVQSNTPTASTATAPTAASHAQPSPPRKAQPAAASPGPQATSTWAALLKQQADKQPTTPVTQPAAQPAAAHAKPSSPGPEIATAGAPAEAPAGPSSQAADLPPAAPRSFSATPSNCIVVKNLPQAHLALEELETEFSKFGAIMRRGQAADIQIHNLGREEGKVAYIKYSDPAAVDAAIAATVNIHGRQCEIKRFDPSQPSSYSSRGGRSSFRGGSRGGGRGSFGVEGGGRGQGRGGGDRAERGDRGPRGDRPPRGEGGGRGARSASAGRRDGQAGGGAAGAQGDA